MEFYCAVLVAGDQQFGGGLVEKFVGLAGGLTWEGDLFLFPGFLQVVYLEIVIAGYAVNKALIFQKG